MSLWLRPSKRPISHAAVDADNNMLCIQYLSTATADSGVKFNNLCIKRQTLRQSVEQRRPTADYGPPGRKWPLPRGHMLMTLFIRLNTSVPASAACERLFSCAGLTMNSHRTRMSDKLLFEQLVLWKANKPLYSLQWLPHLHQYIACRYRPMMTLLLTPLYVVLSQVGWLEFTVPCQHKYGYIRDEYWVRVFVVTINC